ncbi:glycosyltransferase [Photobacterium phosphoreum]|uniref:glycosyltransferase family 2 protein n=1 Tax=Photobacterium phosphoreum TaxID=659 RepID=UPI001E5B4469|nr:glycosyltransferase family A protein [Photobacterium phosphoreum]MCD9504170.1 glycosyltransferase [Photobacterium phosphoreum]
MISVVMPVYNSSKTIINALTSVINQDITNVKYEIIIINDGSNDDSELLINSFINDNPLVDIKYFFQKNAGVSIARNKGIKLAKYEWIAFLDSDDEWCDHKLSAQIDIITNKNINIDFIGCARNNENLYLKGKLINKLHKATVKELLTKMYPQTSTALVRKRLLEKLNGYDETMTHCEDGELWVRICASGDFYYLPESYVITGGGKFNFGDHGLSSNLQKMEVGVNLTLQRAYQKEYISFFEYVFFKMFYKIKYMRRLILTRWRKLCYIK